MRQAKLSVMSVGCFALISMICFRGLGSLVHRITTMTCLVSNPSHAVTCLVSNP